LFIASALAAFLVFLAACAPPDDGIPDGFSIISVRGPQASKGLSGARAFNESLPIAYGHIDSGSPEYLRFTLYKILLNGSFADGGSVANIWDQAAGVEISVGPNGEVDLTGVPDVGALPVGTVTSVKLCMSEEAKIKGSLTNARFDGVSGGTTLYTKAALAYNAHALQGGGALADFTTGPSEETSVWFNGDEGNVLGYKEFEFPASAVLAAGDERPLTILFDISRALRFYDGAGGANSGPSPADSSANAYFFSHSVLTKSIACFFGEPGSIEGYSTLYENSAALAQNLIPGWMTLVLDGSGGILSGLLVGDDDNAGTVLKGLITAHSANPAAGVDFSYDISMATVSGFVAPAAVGGYADAAWTQDGLAGRTGGGTARFTLQLKISP
jgi:hypothetical protein